MPTFASLKPEYDRLWAKMVVIQKTAALAQARRVISNKKRYQEIEDLTGVPWFVIGCLHIRESNGDFSTYLGNGQPLNRRTTIVPKGRGPFKSFTDGAVDALKIDKLDQVTEWSAARVAYAMESFNGFGYRAASRNIPSPYLWGGTNIQKPGKFIRDGVYSSTVMDPQLGGMAILRMIMNLDATARFDDVPYIPPPPDIEPTPKPVPKSVQQQTAFGRFFDALVSIFYRKKP